MRIDLVSALLLAATALAAAAPTPPSPPPPPPSPPPASARPAVAPSCKLAGDVVAAEVSRAADLAAKGRAAVPTFATRVYATGGWERTDTAADGKKTKTSGCLSGRDLAQLESDLDGLPWVQKANPMACDALAVTVTDVMIHGKVVWTEELCSAKVLDAKSTAGLADVEAILEAARKAAVPPCCKP